MKNLHLSRLKRTSSLSDHIKYVKNFCSESFCDVFIDESKRHRGKHALLGDYSVKKQVRDADEISFSSRNPLIVDLQDKFKKELHTYVKEFDFAHFIDPRKLNLESCVVSYTNQKGYIPHADSSFVNNEDNIRLFTIIAYFNDDYIGGDLYFPNLGFTIKPKKGSCIIFPSNYMFIHGVKPVIGFKLISPCWFHAKLNGFNILDPCIM